VRPGRCGPAVLATLAVLGLALSNPDRAHFERFAAEQLVDELEQHVCRGDVLPVLVRLALRNCPQLVQAQRQAIGALVGQHTLRRNLGVLSLYQSDLGGEPLFGWPVPRFQATVVGIAGQLVLVQAGVETSQP
jgi:hypothetical protein